MRRTDLWLSASIAVAFAGVGLACFKDASPRPSAATTQLIRR